jgi:hypothetical protein
MVRLEVHYTLQQTLMYCSCGCNWNGIGTTTADTIDEVTENFIAWAASATGTIIDNNNAPTVATITLLRLLKDLMWYSTLH